MIDHLDVGGAQRQLVELVRRLPREEWDPVVVCLSTSRVAMAGELRRDGIAVECLNQFGKIDLRCLWQLRRLLQRLEPRLVHTWLFTADTYGRVASWLSGNRPTVCSLRSTIADMPPHYRLVNRWLGRGTSCITVNTGTAREELVRERLVHPAKIRVIANGFDLSRYAASVKGVLPPAWPIPAGRKVIAMVARLSPPKDFKTLLAAMQRVATEEPNSCLLLAGDGPLRNDVEQQIDEMRVRDHVHLLGERQDVWQILQHVDVFVLSTTYEGSSNAIMEAMAAGLPVVATDVGGNPELVTDGENGYVVPARDAGAMADALLWLLRDPEQGKQMGCRGRARVEGQFNLDATVEQTQLLYRELLATRL